MTPVTVQDDDGDDVRCIIWPKGAYCISFRIRNVYSLWFYFLVLFGTSCFSRQMIKHGGEWTWCRKCTFWTAIVCTEGPNKNIRCLHLKTVDLPSMPNDNNDDNTLRQGPRVKNNTIIIYNKVQLTIPSMNLHNNYCIVMGTKCKMGWWWWWLILDLYTQYEKTYQSKGHV